MLITFVVTLSWHPLLNVQFQHRWRRRALGHWLNKKYYRLGHITLNRQFYIHGSWPLTESRSAGVMIVCNIDARQRSFSGPICIAWCSRWPTCLMRVDLSKFMVLNDSRSLSFGTQEKTFLLTFTTFICISNILAIFHRRSLNSC